jgi:MFS family permease
MFMMGVIGVLFGGMLSDRIGRSAGAAIIFVLSGLCSFVAGWLIPAPPLFLIGLGFAYGFLTAADSAIYSTAAVELSPPGRIGSVQAAQSFVGFGVGAIVPVLAGTILDVGGSSAGWGLAFSFNGLLATAGIFALLRLRRSPDAAMLADGRG